MNNCIEDLDLLINYSPMDALEEDSLEQEEPEKTENVEWVVPLSSIDDEFQLREFDQVYLYKQLKDPGGLNTGLYTCFCKDPNNINSDGSYDWVPMNGLLSKYYNVACVEKFIVNLRNNIELVGEPVIKYHPYLIRYTANTRKPIDIFGPESNEIKKTVFELVTGLPVETFSNLNSKVKVCVSNTYNGTRSIRIDYVSGITVDINNTTREFTDFFTLCNYAHSFEHLSGSIGLVNSDLNNIQGYLNSSMSILRGYTSGMDKIISEVAKRLRKAGRDKFLNFVDGLCHEHKNMWMIMLVTSVCLSSDYHILAHSELSSYFDREIKRIYTLSQQTSNQ